MKGDNENRAYVSKRYENAAVLIEKKENKPWTQRSVKTYLRRANAEAVSKSMPFFTTEEERTELAGSKARQKEIRAQISDIQAQRSSGERPAAEADQGVRELRKEAVRAIAKESLLETLIYRKKTAEKLFLRRINYAYDYQKADIENYYRERKKELEAEILEAADAQTPPEDEETT